MTFLPIVERELRVAARRPSTYWIRFFAASGALLIILILLLGAGQISQPRLSQQLFIALGVAALGVALLAGVFLTADCLSEEKREGTLGLLFLTDLKGYDVVLGKLTATSIHALYGLLAIFPLLGLPLLTGGVTGGEFWRVMLVLLVTLFLSLALGMFSSALNRDARQAMSGAFVGMLALGGILPALWWLQMVLTNRGWTGLLLWPSPVYAYRAAFDFCYRSPSGPPQFWGAIQVVTGFGLLFLVASAVWLPRVWRQAPRDNDAVAAPAGAPAFADGPRAAGNWPTRSELLLNPFLWLARSALARTRLPWALIGFLTLLWLSFLLAAIFGASRWRDAVVACFFIHYGLHQLGKYLVAVEASRQLSQDKQSGALELLLVTPLSEANILSGLTQALRQHFARLRALLVVMNGTMMGVMVVFSERLHMSGNDQRIFLELYFGGLVMLLLDFPALIRVGMWMALRAKKHHRAVLGTLGRVLLPPWVAILLLVFLLQRGGVSGNTFAGIFGCWFLFGMITDLVVGTQASRGLAAGFRHYLLSPENHLAQSTAPVPGPGLKLQRA